MKEVPDKLGWDVLADSLKYQLQRYLKTGEPDPRNFFISAQIEIINTVRKSLSDGQLFFDAVPRLYRVAAVKPVPIFDHDDVFIGRAHTVWFIWGREPRQRERMQELITGFDYWVGDRLDELEADGVAENTIIFFWSDHGAGLPRNKRWLYGWTSRIDHVGS